MLHMSSVAHNLISARSEEPRSRASGPYHITPNLERSTVCLLGHALKDDPCRSEEGSTLFVSEILCIRLGHQCERNDSCV